MVTNPRNKFFFVLAALCCHFICVSQNTTLNRKNTSEKTALAKHKVMIIPFEPRMYMSEIDMYINQESKLDGKKIRATFRDAMDEQLYKALKSHYNVVDLMDDTVKTKKDLVMIYQHLGYEYQKVPDQEHYAPPKREKEEKAITNGQLTAGTNTDLRFMNAKVQNAKLVPYLYDKYKCDIFVFLNQLDLRSSTGTDASGMINTNGMRKAVLHYTVYSYDAIELNSGIAEQEFPATVNNPAKISSGYLSKVAQTVSSRIDKALAVPAK